MTERKDVTQLLQSFDTGAARGDELQPIVYDELRRLANVMMQQERPGQTLQPTALVHEAYVRLSNGEEERLFNDQRHFFNAAALAMRRVLLDRARRRGRVRHGGDHARVDLDVVDLPITSEFELNDVEMLERALQVLSREKPRWSEVVHLRLFAGLSIDQTAELLGVARTTVKEDWRFARAWLKAEINAEQ